MGREDIRSWVEFISPDGLALVIKDKRDGGEIEIPTTKSWFDSSVSGRVFSDDVVENLRKLKADSKNLPQRQYHWIWRYRTDVTSLPRFRNVTTRIPRGIKYLTGLTTLSLSNMWLSNIDIPDEIAELNKLEHLHLTRNGLTKINPILFSKKMHCLKTLDLSHNNIDTLTLPPLDPPATSNACAPLSTSNACAPPSASNACAPPPTSNASSPPSTSNVCAPPSTRGPSHIKILRLDHNPIYEIPQSFSKHFPRLESLHLSSTKIRTLPDSLGSLQNLKILRMHSSPLCFLPKGLAKIPTLTAINVANTRLLTIPSLPSSVSVTWNPPNADHGYRNVHLMYPRTRTVAQTQMLFEESLSLQVLLPGRYMVYVPRTTRTNRRNKQRERKEEKDGKDRSTATRSLASRRDAYLREWCGTWVADTKGDSVSMADTKYAKDDTNDAKAHTKSPKPRLHPEPSTEGNPQLPRCVYKNSRGKKGIVSVIVNVNIGDTT
eukprot:1358675-Amorphochlora_amoeboformis.AAC.1